VSLLQQCNDVETEAFIKFIMMVELFLNDKICLDNNSKISGCLSLKLSSGDFIIDKDKLNTLIQIYKFRMYSRGDIFPYFLDAVIRKEVNVLDKFQLIFNTREYLAKITYDETLNKFKLHWPQAVLRYNSDTLIKDTRNAAVPKLTSASTLKIETAKLNVSEEKLSLLRAAPAAPAAPAVSPRSNRDINKSQVITSENGKISGNAIVSPPTSPFNKLLKNLSNLNLNSSKFNRYSPLSEDSPVSNLSAISSLSTALSSNSVVAPDNLSSDQDQAQIDNTGAPPPYPAYLPFTLVSGSAAPPYPASRP
jgi:hypothetical protein